ncbi:hypothetical protein BDW72DRAFT_195788 [Aspergillus terricola var. indicus]
MTENDLSCLLYGPGNARFDNRPVPQIEDPHDALIRISYVGVCGSDVNSFSPFLHITLLMELTEVSRAYGTKKVFVTDISEKKRGFASGYMGCGTMAPGSTATPAEIARQFRKEMSLEEGVDVQDRHIAVAF